MYSARGIAPLTQASGGLADLFRPTKATLGIVAAFLAVCLAIAIFGDPDCLTYGGRCAFEADRYGHTLAEMLYRHGQFVSLSEPSHPYVVHPPLHALIMTATFYMAGGETYIPILVLHILLNVVTGFLVRAIVLQIAGRCGDVAMVLYLLNPNVLAHANLVGTDTLPALFIAGASLALLRYLDRRSLATALVCGVLIGVGTMIRPIATTLIVALPFAFPLATVIRGGWSSLFDSVKAGLVAFIAAMVIVAPWMIHMNNQGYAYSVSNPGHFRLLLLDSLPYLTPAGPRKAVMSAKIDYMVAEQARMVSTVPGWDEMGEGERTRILTASTLDHFLSFPFEPDIFAKALVYSWGRFLLSSGSGYINARLGISELPEDRGALFYAVYGLTHLITFSMRILGVLGLVWLVRRRAFPELMIVVVPIALVLLTTFMVGRPRYTAAVEAELAVLAALGLFWLVDRYRRRKTARLPAN